MLVRRKPTFKAIQYNLISLANVKMLSIHSKYIMNKADLTIIKTKPLLRAPNSKGPHLTQIKLGDW